MKDGPGTPAKEAENQNTRGGATRSHAQHAELERPARAAPG
jgi:hypothetical protein